jgi:putative transposase
MRRPLQRYYGRGDLHFITFSCDGRRPYLGTRSARDCFVEVLGQLRARIGIPLIGYVVMPEHVHLLIGEGSQSKSSPSKVLQILKQTSSRVLREGRHSGEIGKGGKPFWQRRFYDFNVWSAAKLREKLAYMHANPVERGLVSHPKDWPWSSWSFYEKGEEGLVVIDTVGSREREQSKQDRERKSQNPHP